MEYSGAMKREEKWEVPQHYGKGKAQSATTSAPSAIPSRQRTQPRQDMKGLEEAVSVKRWSGGGSTPEPWGKLRKDPELWDEEGDTLIYFGHERPEASFRIKSSVLRGSGSPYFITLLREGVKGDGNYVFSTCSASPPSLTPSTKASTLNSDRSSVLRHPKVSLPFGGFKKHVKPTPSRSDASSVGDDLRINHEIFIPAPPDASRTDMLRHHLTTRNVIAMLLNKSLVGLSFFQALIDLQERLQVYMPSDARSAGFVIRYLVSNRLHDVRNDPAAATGLLAWCEEPSVLWEEGWREAFVHCVGMYARLSSLPEIRDLSVISRALLERSNLDLQVRIQMAEDRLAGFEFEEIWPAQSIQTPAAHASFDRFRRFLKQHYGKIFKDWPVSGTQADGSGWLTRPLVRRLQEDFGALYDHLVDRDVCWEEFEARGGRRWKIVRRRDGVSHAADSDDLPISEMFAGFDNRNGNPHIPHPYPLLPRSIPVHSGKNESHSLLGGKKRKGSEKLLALAYSEASNSLILETSHQKSELVDMFIKYEKAEGDVDPLDARKGRWILLYCILQVLASVSVDTPDLAFTDNVSYFLNTRLKGTPPWAASSNLYKESSRLLSHCWVVPEKWARGHIIGDLGLPERGRNAIERDDLGDGIESTVTTDGEEQGLPQPWLYDSAAGSLGGSDSTTHSSRSSCDGPAKGWPGQGTNVKPSREVGLSDYKPPEGW
ncbi:MAG: hypothetical protein M1832_005432 [Thelocarpon impressellum]|nr:MAG: hypothetical protein M1832_005432 [Thelocarpon impressellum]